MSILVGAILPAGQGVSISQGLNSRWVAQGWKTKMGEDVGGNGKSKSTTLSKMLSQEQESTAIALSEDAPEIEAGDHNGWRDSLMFR